MMHVALSMCLYEFRSAWLSLSLGNFALPGFDVRHISQIFIVADHKSIEFLKTTSDSHCPFPNFTCMVFISTTKGLVRIAQELEHYIIIIFCSNCAHIVGGSP